jgi:uncharacterized membrane protein YbhN (UPF0104 family)
VRRLDLTRVTIELARARPAWIAAAAICYLSILPLWALQWWLLAPTAPERTPRVLLGVIAMTSSVLNTAPMLVGEAAGVQFLSTETQLDRASGLAVLAMDQLLVGIAKVAVLSAAALLLPLPPGISQGVRVLVAGVGVLLLALLVAAWLGPYALRRRSVRTPSRIEGVVVRMLTGLSPLRSPVRAVGALALALLKKCAELLAILAIQHAFGVPLPMASALLVLAALNLATLLPLVPGNAGVFEAAMVFAYVQLGVPAERALGMAVVQHVCYFVALALPGYWWLARSAARSSAAAP